MEYLLPIVGGLGNVAARVAPKSGRKHRKIHNSDFPLTIESIRALYAGRQPEHILEQEIAHSESIFLLLRPASLGTPAN